MLSWWLRWWTVVDLVAKWFTVRWETKAHDRPLLAMPLAGPYGPLVRIKTMPNPNGTIA